MKAIIFYSFDVFKVATEGRRPLVAGPPAVARALARLKGRKTRPRCSKCTFVVCSAASLDFCSMSSVSSCRNDANSSSIFTQSDLGSPILSSGRCPVRWREFIRKGVANIHIQLLELGLAICFRLSEPFRSNGLLHPPPVGSGLESEAPPLLPRQP